VSLDEPYESLFYNRKRLQSVDEGYARQRHIKLLLEFMKEEHSSTWHKLDEIEEERCGQISFEHLWLLYPPKSTVFKKDGGGWRAYRIERVEVPTHSKLDALRILGYYLDFDRTGQWLVPKLEVLSIHPYSCDRPIANLEVVPDEYISRICNRNDLGRKLIERGSEYWCYKGQPVYKEYKGDAWPNISHNASISSVTWNTFHLLMLTTPLGSSESRY
jgi:hypothetical protein